MKCNRCGRELSESESYIHQQKVFCEDCLMDIGLSSKDCDPWATYVDTRTKGHPGREDLSMAEKTIYEFILSRGKATREEVMQQLSLSKTDLNTQLIPLIHADLVKELGESGQMYLFPVPAKQ